MLCTLLTSQVSAQTPVSIGPGDDVGGSIDADNGERLNVAVAAGTFYNAPAGTYQVRAFSFESASTHGVVRPFVVALSTSSPRTYEVLWTGAPVTLTQASVGTDLTASYAAGSETFTVSSATNLYGGFFTDGGGRVSFVAGGATDHASSFVRFSAPNAVPSGADISGIDYVGLGRSYRFQLAVVASGAGTPPPEPPPVVPGTSLTPIGPGHNLTGARDVDSGDRLNLSSALAEGAVLAAGTYEAADFSFETGSSAGQVTPFLAVPLSTSPLRYRVLWVGGTVDVAARNVPAGGLVTTSYAAGSAPLTLTTSARVYAGFFTSSGGRVRFVGGESTDHDDSFARFSKTQVESGSYDLDGFSHPRLDRAYLFEVRVRGASSTGGGTGTTALQAGPGTSVAGAADVDNGDRLNIASSTTTRVTARSGNYAVSSFAFENGAAGGKVLPFLARLINAGAHEYEVVWVGPAAVGSPASVGSIINSAYPANSQVFAVPADGELYAGFFTAEGGRVRFVNGGTTDHDDSFAPFYVGNPNAGGADVASLSYPGLARSYRFAITLAPTSATPPPPNPLAGLDSDKPVTLDLSGYQISFRDEFDGPLDVSARGPGTRWIAHTPTGGDFGDAWFTDPVQGYSPFSIANGVLSITARYDTSVQHWRSGLLASVDPQGNGFSQQYGYFEMRAKFPAGAGTWPAFWMLNRASLLQQTDGFEVDVVEHYGHGPQELHTVWHQWFASGSHGTDGKMFRVENLSAAFHDYGFLWDANEMIWYFDGKELWRMPTKPEARQPLYMMLNLALGGGWPINQTPNPSVMQVDYVRAYKKN